MKPILLSVFASIFTFFAFSQTKLITSPELRKIETAYQHCLNKGVGMHNCAQKYYLAIDSLLNLSYQQLRSRLDVNSREALKKDQLIWLKKRDRKFKEIHIPQNAGKDDIMIAYDSKAEFVKERVAELISRIRETR